MFAFEQKSDFLLKDKKLTFRHNHFLDVSEFSRFPKGFTGDFFQFSDEDFQCYLSQIFTDKMTLGLYQHNSRILFKGSGLNNFAFSFSAFHYGSLLSHKYRINTNTISIIYAAREMAALRNKFHSNYVLVFEDNFLDNLCESLELSQVKKQLDAQSIPPVIKCDGQKINYVRQICHQIYQLLFQINYQPYTPINSLLINHDIKQKLEEEVGKNLIIAMAEATEIQLKKPRINRSSILKKAEDFYFSNLKSDITTQDVCQKLKVSQRNLEYVFKEYYQISPKKYFKHLRLNALHQELLRNDEKRNIREITEELGFYHRGQLAKDYHQLFGEFPSETFKR